MITHKALVWRCAFAFVVCALVCGQAPSIAVDVQQPVSRPPLETSTPKLPVSRPPLETSVSIQKPTALISLVSPSLQSPGKPITIEINGLPEGGSALQPEVTIGGLRASILNSTFVDSGSALISAVVPSDLSTVEEPVIYVRMGNTLLRYKGVFGLLPSNPLLGWNLIQYREIAIAGLTLAVAFGAVMYFSRRRRAVTVLAGKGALAADALVLTPGTAELEVGIPDPEPPEDLLHALRAGECVAVIGSGMSAQAGLMPWSDILRQIIDDAVDVKEGAQLQFLLSGGRLDEVVESLGSLLSPANLADRIGRAIESQKPRDMTTYSALARLPLAAVVTLNFDDLAEKTWQSRSPLVLMPHQSERALDAFSRDEFFVFRFNGALGKEEMFLSYQQVKDAVSRNDAFRDLLRRLYYSRTLLFVGASMEGAQTFFRSIDRTAVPTRRHFALVEVRDSSWEHVARSLESQFGLKVLPFTRRDRGQAIRKFLAASAVEEVPAQEKPAIAKLSRVELRNIGPFSEVEFDIDPCWTVLLGDNGVGKSTILKAIAVCMTGKSSEPIARRLVRSGGSSGEIALHFGSHKYLTTIALKSGGGVALDSPSGVPLEREGILTVGYSALRTIGGQRAEATESGAQRPVAADLMPLTSEQPDPRLEGIKQWIVRLDRLKNSDSVAEADRQRYAALYDSVFSMFRTIAEGVDFEPGGVNSTGEIIIKTRDGPVPLESLSQGTLSLVAWTGSFLQRMYETAPAGADPRGTPAIVLVDEIDAHMHPAWQQSLVARLSEIFTNTQFIVTSHSPLVVGGLDPQQVYRVERNARGRVEIANPEHSLKGLGAAGLLTSSLFGLRSQLDIETARKLDHKRQLTAKVLNHAITPGEKEDLSKLEAELRDIDFTQSVRDPLYPQFVQAMAAVNAKSQIEEAPIVLSSEQREEKSKIAEQIVRELIQEKEQTAEQIRSQAAP